jgi:hypothetical protein
METPKRSEEVVNRLLCAMTDTVTSYHPTVHHHRKKSQVLRRFDLRWIWAKHVSQKSAPGGHISLQE